MWWARLTTTDKAAQTHGQVQKNSIGCYGLLIVFRDFSQTSSTAFAKRDTFKTIALQRGAVMVDVVSQCYM